MGQKSSSEPAVARSRLKVSSYANPWSLILTETVENWVKIADSYGFSDYPYGCVDRECDRDLVCLKRANAILKKHNNVFEIHRFKQNAKVVSYANQPKLKVKVNQGFQLSKVIPAVQGDSVVLILYRWERLQYEAVFVLVDLSSCKVVGHFESPMTNMSIMECKMSPDGSCIAVLFYFRQKPNFPFQYDLYLFSTETFEVLDIVPCNTEVRPYVTFDPRFRSSRLAVVNYNKESEEIKNGLVLYCIKSHKIFAVSHVMLSIIYGGGYFCVNYTPDGRYLILQKISDNMNGIHCYADSYVFDSNSLKLLKHYFANLQAFSTHCDSNYAPLFSCCGSRMCIMSEEVYGDQRKLLVSVYQLPRPLKLQEQCRIIILQNLFNKSDVHKLPLPSSLKQFLEFDPQL